MPPPKNEDTTVNRHTGNPMRNPARGKYKETVGWICRGTKPLEGRVLVSARFYFKGERDIDSGWSLLLDALAGWTYKNDRQVKIGTQRVYTRNKDPHVDVRVLEW